MAVTFSGDVSVSHACKALGVGVSLLSTLRWRGSAPGPLGWIFHWQYLLLVCLISSSHSRWCWCPLGIIRLGLQLIYIVLSNDLTSYVISVYQSLLIPSNETGLYGGLPNHRFMGLFLRLQTAYKEYMYASRSSSLSVLILLVAAWTLILWLFMLFKNWSTVISSRPDEFKNCNTSPRKRSASTHVHISSSLFLFRAHNCPVYFRGEVFVCTYTQVCSKLGDI